VVYCQYGVYAFHKSGAFFAQFCGMKSPKSFFPFMEYRISIHISNSSSFLHQSMDYYKCMDRMNHYLSPHFLVISFVVLPNQIHLLVSARSLQKQESIREFSDALRSGILHTFLDWMSHDERNELFILPIPSQGVERASIIKQSIQYIHSLPVSLGLVSQEEDWPFSSFQWLKKGCQLHPLSKWLNEFLLDPGLLESVD
jgi:REP element-mobilizing transposase RayT